MEIAQQHQEEADKAADELVIRFVKITSDITDLRHQDQQIVTKNLKEIKRLLKELIEQTREQSSRLEDFIKLNGNEDDMDDLEFLRKKYIRRPRRPEYPIRGRNYNRHVEERPRFPPPIRKSPPNLSSSSRYIKSTHGYDDIPF